MQKVNIAPANLIGIIIGTTHENGQATKKVAGLCGKISSENILSKIPEIMHQINLKQNPQVKSKFESYPKNVKKRLNYLRDLVLMTASEIESIKEIEETLKWGEPSYLVKKGSTIRMDWKPKAPNQYAMYFKCTSRLVETFKLVYGDLFKYEKNRAILFDLDEDIPEKELKECITMALKYHSLKSQPLLGK